MKSTYLKSALALAVVAAATQTAVAGPVGYGAATTGGGSKAAVTVTSLAAAQAAVDSYDGSSGLVLNYTGTFNFASISDPCTQHSKAAQILEVKNKNNITIKGANGSSANFGIHIAGTASNIIVQNMTIGLLPGGEAADSISIEGMSSGAPSNVWIDHNTIFSKLVDCSGAGDASFDGAIDNKKGAKNITYSYNYIHDHQKVALNGHSDSDSTNSSMTVTYHHNRFENVKSRLPLQRMGKTHSYNNYYNNVSTSGINVRMGGIALIESNYFENVKNPVTSRDSSSIGYWDLRNNYVGANITWDTPDSATVNATNWTTTKAFGSTGYSYTVDSAACVKSIVIATAGAGTNLATTASCSATSSSSSSKASSSTATSSSSSSKASSSSSSVASSSSSSKASSSAASSSSSSASGAPVLTGTGDYPDGFSKCANLGETCSVSKGTGWVAFGRKGSWVTKKVTVGGSIACTVAAFGSDPAGNPNKCSIQN
ncbi:polysaccharide lyase family 1 protein [Uliginosibacterium sp. H3]|uniref:Polysaccharide lyase family 1 protein n=1 Tax=Uliginosibacterium silvisoli TaxID=3114758 RepID=A0ABU6K5Z5_9RHOO|nr:polysaccharide lyase family 1 protein [Uliginosibacterium sp. H3]